MDQKKYFAYAQLAAGMSLGGASVVVGKSLSHLPIFFVQSVCLAFALIFIIPLARIKEGRLQLASIKKKDYALMLLQGFSGVFMFRLFMMLALRNTSAASTGIALSTTPAVLAIFSIIFLKEKIGLKSSLAVALCFLGMFLLNADLKSFSIKMEASLVLGNFFAFLSVCSEAMFTIFRKKQSFSDKPLTSTAVVMFFAFLLFLPVGGFQIASNIQTIINIGIRDIVLMFVYGAVCSSAAYALWLGGLAKIKINEAAGFTGFMPISSVALSALVLREKITFGHLAGMAFVLSGIYIIAFGNEAGSSQRSENKI